MGNFFKTFGKGILYFITLPLLILFLAIYLVVSVIGFIIVGIKGLILFFKGENITGKTKEDIEAEEKLAVLIDPINAALKQVEQAQLENKTPILNIDPNDRTLNVTAIKNPEPVQQIPVNQNVNNNEVNINNSNQNINVAPVNNNIKQDEQIFEQEPEEVKETKVVEFKKPEKDNIISEDELDEINDYNTIDIQHVEQVKSDYNPYSNNDYLDDDDDEENKPGVSFQEYLGDDDK